jgi:hypothetical protein
MNTDDLKLLISKIEDAEYYSAELINILDNDIHTVSEYEHYKTLLKNSIKAMNVITEHLFK